ncbi:hypothetical protein N9917_01235 [Deltaproteobacteria bacterium]|nr:hypothetical protein [Deltaproteobacteria bacterium]
MSALLFYGPGAEDEALQRAESIGRLLADPFGSEGLKVADARAMTTLMSAPPVGSQIGVLVAGPMDKATPEAQDALLKHLEEFDADTIQPVLWASDVGAVFPTIRSRCLMEWCPHGAQAEMELLSDATSLVRAAMEKDYATTIFFINEFEGNTRDLLNAVSMVVADKLKTTKKPEPLLRLWGSVREFLGGRNPPSKREALAALLVAKGVR